MKENLCHMIEQLLASAEKAYLDEDPESTDSLSLWWLGYKAALRDVLNILSREQGNQI